MPNPFYVSRLDSVYDENPKRYDLSVILKEIREGKTTIANSHTAEDFEHRILAAYTRYTGNFTITQNVKDAKAEYELDNNSAARFITENTIADDGAELEENSIYPSYVKWCENEGIKTPFTKTSFRKNMEEHGYKRRRGEKDNTRYFYFEGVRWQNASDATPEEFDEDTDPHPEVGF